MKPMQTGARLLPVDQNGRVRMPAAQRSAILAEFATSGMTGVAFAAHVGVKNPTFAGWIRQDRAVRGAERQPLRAKQVSQRLRFVEAAPVQAPTVNVLDPSSTVFCYRPARNVGIAGVFDRAFFRTSKCSAKTFLNDIDTGHKLSLIR
jgi:hypothetical protein